MKSRLWRFTSEYLQHFFQLDQAARTIMNASGGTDISLYLSAGPAFEPSFSLKTTPKDLHHEPNLPILT